MLFPAIPWKRTASPMYVLGASSCYFYWGCLNQQANTHIEHAVSWPCCSPWVACQYSSRIKQSENTASDISVHPSMTCQLDCITTTGWETEKKLPRNKTVGPPSPDTGSSTWGSKGIQAPWQSVLWSPPCIKAALSLPSGVIWLLSRNVLQP